VLIVPGVFAGRARGCAHCVGVCARGRCGKENGGAARQTREVAHRLPSPSRGLVCRLSKAPRTRSLH
jgi:hypothetical protein